MRGQRDDRNRRSRRVRLQLARERQPILSWQLDVHHDQIRKPVAHLLHGVGSGSRKPDLEAYGRKVALLAEACEAIGRDPKEIKRSFQCGYLVGRDGKEILERAAQMRTVIPRFKDMEPSDVVEAARAGWLVGTPAEIAEQLRPYLELGLTRWHVQHFLLDDDEGLRLLMEGTAPAIA